MTEQTIHLERYSVLAKNAIAQAQSLADHGGHQEVTPNHVVAALLENGHGKDAFRRSGLDPDALLNAVRRELGKLPKVGPLAYLSSKTLVVLKHAETRATIEKRANVDVECVFAGLVEVGAISRAIFSAPWPKTEWGSENPPPPPPAPEPPPTTVAAALLRSARPLKALADSLWTVAGTPELKLASHAMATLGQIRRTLGFPTPPPLLGYETISDYELKIERVESERAPIMLEYKREGMILEHADQRIVFQWVEDEMAWKSTTGAELFATLEVFISSLYPELNQA